MKFTCPRCNYFTPGNAHLCVACGRPLPLNEEPIRKSAKPKPHKRKRSRRTPITRDNDPIAS